MRKSLLIFIILLLLSISASFLSLILVRKPYECIPEEGTGCILIYKLVWLGFPFNILNGPFDKEVMFVANVVFYFLVFSGIYFVYSRFIKKKKR